MLMLIINWHNQEVKNTGSPSNIFSSVHELEDIVGLFLHIPSTIGCMLFMLFAFRSSYMFSYMLKCFTLLHAFTVSFHAGFVQHCFLIPQLKQMHDIFAPYSLSINKIFRNIIYFLFAIVAEK